MEDRVVGFAGLTQLHQIEKAVRDDVLFLLKEYKMEEEAERLVVNIQQLRGGMGRYAPKAWTINNEKERDELCLNPDQLLVQKNPLDCLDGLVHCICHYYCNRKGIQDTSRKGHYHNKRFKEIAEEYFHLKCYRPGKGEKGSSAGWNTCAAINEEYLSALNARLPYPFTGSWYRNQEIKEAEDGETPISLHLYRYACPICGQSARFSNKRCVNVLCLNCNTKFEWLPKKGTKEYELYEREQDGENTDS